jgi:hypothetical protein
MITPTGGFACRRTNKSQLQITEIIFISRFTIWSLIFVPPCGMRFGTYNLLFKALTSLGLKTIHIFVCKENFDNFEKKLK